MMQGSSIPGPVEDDPLVGCLRFVCRRFEMPFPAQILLSSLARDVGGRIPWHQLGPAIELIGLEYDFAGRRLPTDNARFPLIVKTEDGAAVLLEREGEDVLVALGDTEPVWAPRSRFEPIRQGEAITVFGASSHARDVDMAWHERGRDHWFWGELRKMRYKVWPVLLASLILNLLSVALPLFSMNVYDRVLPNHASSTLWVLAIGVMLAFAVEFGLRRARTSVIDEVSRDLDVRLSEKIFSRVVATPLSERKGSVGSLAAKVTEFSNVREFFASTTVVLVVDVLFLFVFVLFIALLAGWLALVPLVAIAVMAVLGVTLQRRVTAASIEAQADFGLQQTLLVEAVSSVETLKSLSSEGVFLGRWRRLTEIGAQSQQRLRNISSVAVSAASTVQQMCNIMLIVGGYYLFVSGSITMGAIVAIVMLSGRALSPISQLAYLLTRWRQSAQTLSSLQNLWDQPDERRMGSAVIAPTVRTGRIVFDQVGFRYPGAATDALSNVSLSIEPGERIAVIGRVASGKSTFGRVLCGLYPVTDGTMTVDGIDSRQFQPHLLRSALRFVGQDANLFSGSIKDNLKLGAPEATDEQLLDALRMVGADRFLAGDHGGFDRQVGDYGRQISGGQRSFLVLARALAQPSNLLFLDEPTGAMDSQTEKLFLQSLSDSMTPRTSLIVSTHRPAVFAICNRIVILDQGRVVADGSRDELMSRAGEMAKT